MTVTYIGKQVLEDNELAIFDELFTVVKHADCCPKVTIDRKESYVDKLGEMHLPQITCHIRPSDEKFKSRIVRNILHVNHKKRSYRVHFSKSLAVSKTISFTISL